MRYSLTGMFFVLLVTAGCLPPGSQPFGNWLPVAPSGEAEVGALVKGNNTFAPDLYGQLCQGQSNLIFSPYSISTALAMTRAGARGKTAEEMDKVLHFTLPPQKLHSACAALIHRINAERSCQLTAANGLWTQKHQGLRPEFVTLVRDQYNGGVYEVDFVGAAEESRRKINQWTETQTQGKIGGLLPTNALSSDTWLVLTNAIYFKGKWERPFQARDTHTETFHLPSGQTAQVPLMHQTEKFGYGEDERMQVLEMPYAGHSLAMVVVLPKKQDGLSELEAGLSADALAGWIRLLQVQEVQVSVPRFRFGQAMQLQDVLKRMGLRLVFSDNADFSGMKTGWPSVKLKAVFHKTVIVIETKEEGTEAAAATAVQMTSLASAPGSAPRARVFRADHPFLFLIRDTKTGSVLFLGRVADPSK
jgi:serpin B